MCDYVVINNKFVKKNKACISIQERGFLFGDGIFDTIYVYKKVIYNFPAHIERLKSGLDAIKINYNINNIKNSCIQLIDKNNIYNGLLRVYISRGIGSIGYLPVKNINPLTIIETKNLYNISAENISLWVSKIEKISMNSIPTNYKLSQGLNSILAKMDAQDNNCFDALMLNNKKLICETSAANIFWIKNDIIYTPDKSCGCLLGTIRNKIIKLSHLKIITTRSKLPDILDADEVFITNTSFRIINVNKIMPNNISFKQTKYRKIFTELLNNDVEKYVKENS